MSTIHIRAKTFRTGGSLAIRLPKSCRIVDPGADVLIEREGDALVIRPVRFSQRFLDCLGSLAGEEIPTMPRNRTRLRDRAVL